MRSAGPLLQLQPHRHAAATCVAPLCVQVVLAVRSMEGQIVRVVQDCAAQQSDDMARQSEEMAAHALEAYNTAAKVHNAAQFTAPYTASGIESGGPLMPTKNADGELPPPGAR